MTTFLLWAIPSTILVCLVYSRYSHSTAQRNLAHVLSVAGRQEVERLAALSTSEQMFARATYSGAAVADPAEMGRLLDAAYEYIAGITEGRLSRLSKMAQLARMAAALAPVPPVMPRDFVRGDLRTLAGLSSIAHHLLVGSSERFRLHVSMLGLGFRLVLRALRKAPAGPAWEAGLDDWSTLDDAHVAAFRAVVLSLEAEALKARQAS